MPEPISVAVTCSGALDNIRVPSLRANVVWTLASNFVSAACQWGMVVSIAKMGNPVMVGQYALALAIVAPWMLFSNLQLRAIQATDVRGEFEFGDYLGLRILATVVVIGAIVLLVEAGSYQSATALTILGLMVSKAFEGISDIFYGFLQQRERLDCIARSIILRMPVSLVFLAFAIHLTHSVFIGTLGLTVVQILVLICYDIPVSLRVARQAGTTGNVRPRLRFAPKWRVRILKRLTWTALPLGAAMLLISLQTNVPRYFIDHYIGVGEVGVFAALAYFLAAGNIVTDAVGQSITPRLAHAYRNRELSKARGLLLRLAGLGLVGGGLAVAMGYVAGPRILTLLYRPEYAKYMNVFLLLLLSAGPTYIASFFGYAMTAARVFWLQLPLSLFSTGTVALACMCLIPSKGLIGAAEAVLLLSLVRLLATSLVLAKVS